MIMCTVSIWFGYKLIFLTNLESDLNLRSELLAWIWMCFASWRESEEVEYLITISISNEFLDILDLMGY